MSTRRLLLLATTLGAIFTTLLMGPAPAMAASNPAPGTAAARAAQMAKARTSFMGTVARLDPYVVRAADGTLSLQAPKSVTDRVDPNVLGHLRLNLVGIARRPPQVEELNAAPCRVVLASKGRRLLPQPLLFGPDRSVSRSKPACCPARRQSA